MSKKLFVGGLAWATTDDSLLQAFARFGEVVEAKVIKDRQTGRSRGFGFVTFSEDAAAEAASTQMQGTELDGRVIRIDKADENRPRPEGGNRERKFSNYDNRENNRREERPRFNHSDYTNVYPEDNGGEGRRNRGNRKGGKYRDRKDDDDRW